MIEIEKLRAQVSDVEERLKGFDYEFASRVRKIRARIEAVHKGLLSKTAELNRQTAQLKELKAENDELKKLFGRLLGLFENRDCGRLDQQLTDLGDKVDALVELAKAEVKEVSIEWDAGKPSTGSQAADPKPTLRSQKYDTEWFRKVEERVSSLTEDIRSAEAKEKPVPKARWNDKAYGPPPQRITENSPSEPISTKLRQSNAA